MIYAVANCHHICDCFSFVVTVTTWRTLCSSTWHHVTCRQCHLLSAPTSCHQSVGSGRQTSTTTESFMTVLVLSEMSRMRAACCRPICSLMTVQWPAVVVSWVWTAVTRLLLNPATSKARQLVPEVQYDAVIIMIILIIVILVVIVILRHLFLFLKFDVPRPSFQPLFCRCFNVLVIFQLCVTFCVVNRHTPGSSLHFFTTCFTF